MTELAYDVAGVGRPIVFLHGALTTRRVFGYQLLSLSRTNRVIAVDLPGHGQSSWSPTEAWLLQSVDRVSTLLGQLRVNDPVIVGWSLGGLVARGVVDQIDAAHLVLVGVSTQTIEDSTRKRMERQMLSDFPRFARRMVRGFTSSAVSQETEDWLFSMALSTGIDVHIASLIHTNEILRPPPPERTTSFVGARDQIVTSTARTDDDIPEIVFPRSGHAPFLEEQENFNKCITELATS